MSNVPTGEIPPEVVERLLVMTEGRIHLVTRSSLLGGLLKHAVVGECVALQWAPVLLDRHQVICVVNDKSPTKKWRKKRWFVLKADGGWARGEASYERVA